MDLRVDYSRSNPEPTPVPGDFGMSRFRAVQERAGVIAKLGGQVADIATSYAAKNKRADLRADAMAFETQAKTIQSAAQLEAEQTSDPNQVRMIWEKAHSDLNTWVNGKNEKGVPNIRWNDQRGQIIPVADALKADFGTAAERRIAEIGRIDTNAKFQREIYDGTLAGNPEQIRGAVMGMLENGTYTKEQAETALRVNYLKMDLTVAKNQIVAIEGMDPEKALAASQAFEKAMTVKEKDGSWSAFQHIPENDRATMVDQAKKAAGKARQRAENAEVSRLQADLVSGAFDSKAAPEKVEAAYPNLSDGFKLAYRKASSERLPEMNEALIGSAFKDIANTEATPENGILLARRLEAQGFKKDTDAAVWKTFEQKFYPTGGAEDYSDRFAIEKHQLVKAMETANQRTGFLNLRPNPLSTSGDKLSNFNRALARETDAMDSFVKARIKKGVPYETAISDYWEQPRIKTMVDDHNINALLDVTLSPVEVAKRRANAAAGINVLTNTAAAAQSLFYVDAAQAQKLNVPLIY
jgi:hypothetical protein